MQTHSRLYKVGGWRGEFGQADGAVGSGKRVEASGGAVSPGKQVA
jgi:hypothetical protein